MSTITPTQLLNALQSAGIVFKDNGFVGNGFKEHVDLRSNIEAAAAKLTAELATLPAGTRVGHDGTGQQVHLVEDEGATLHQHLLDMLGAKDHVDAGRIIAELHAAQANPSRGVVDEAMVERAMDADAEEYGASIPASRVRRILEAAALQAAALPAVPAFDMLAHLQRQREWSGRTFGPGPRTAGVIDHIRKELREIEVDPTDLSEWIDVVILALDGAWRAGGTPEQIIATLIAKQTKNEGRTWPDWRTAAPDKAIEHDRTHDALPAVDGIPLNEDTKAIFGRMCFQCINLANALRKAGHEIERGAEHEQAAVIHWMLNLYLKHGAGWREAGDTYLAATPAHDQPEGDQ